MYINWQHTAPKDSNFTVRNTSTILSANLEIITGWIALFAAIMIFLGSLPYVRQKGHFQAFFYTHLAGYSIYYIALVMHTRYHKFWKIILVPGGWFLLEKLYSNWMIYRFSGHKVMVRKVVQWPSGVTQLTMDRPRNFDFNPGDYIQIKLPNLAWFEWHPFTISSCPEDEEYLTVHIRRAGDWTRRLHEYFSMRLKICPPTNPVCNPISSIKRRKFNRRTRISILHKKRMSAAGQVLRCADIWVHIKGPYGTPSGQIFEAQHAVLICAGIGVTPFASILQSIVIRHQAALTEQTAQQSHEPVSLGGTIRLKKVDFIWVVKNQRNLEWFVELLEELDAEQQKEERFHNFLEIQIYLTSSTKMNDIHAFALTSALETFYQKYNRDLITGIAARARHGRPNWEDIFQDLETNNHGNVSVFYCGPHLLSRELRRYSNKHKFRFFKESF